LESILTNEWDEYAEQWELNPAVNEYANNAFNALEAEIFLNEALTVLDFGCGTGALTELINSKVKQVVAIDPSTKMIEQLKNKKLINVVTIADYLSNKSIEEHQSLNTKFDLIIASSVCAFLPDYQSTLNLLKNLLKDEGVFVQWDWLSEDESASMGLTKNTVNKALTMTGFNHINIKVPFSIASEKQNMPVMMAIAKTIAKS